MTRRLATGNPLRIVNSKGPKMMRHLLECKYDNTKPSKSHLFLLERSSNTVQLKLQYVPSVFIALENISESSKNPCKKSRRAFFLSFVEE